MALSRASTNPARHEQELDDRRSRRVADGHSGRRPNQFVALKGAHDVVRISVEGESYSVVIAPVPQIGLLKGLNSLSVVGEDLWLGEWAWSSGARRVWDGGAY